MSFVLPPPPVATVPAPPVPVVQNIESSLIPAKKKTGFLSSLLGDKKIKLVNEKENENLVENNTKLSTNTMENKECENNTVNTLSSSLPTRPSVVTISVPEIQTTSQAQEPTLSTKEADNPIIPVYNTVATTNMNITASPTKTELPPVTTMTNISNDVQRTAMNVTTIKQEVESRQPAAATTTSTLLPSSNIEIISIPPTTYPVIAPSLYYNNEFQIMVVPSISTKIANRKQHLEEQNEKRKESSNNHIGKLEREENALSLSSSSEINNGGVWSNKWDVRFSPSTHLPHMHPMSKWNAKDVWHTSRINAEKSSIFDEINETICGN